MLKSLPVKTFDTRLLNQKHEQAEFIKQANTLLKEHSFYDEAISHHSLIEEDDISRDLIVLGFDALEPTVHLNKEDIKVLAQAVGLKVID